MNSKRSFLCAAAALILLIAADQLTKQLAVQYLYQNGYTGRVRNIGINDVFVEHGSIKELRQMLKLDGKGIADSVKEMLSN